MKSYFLEDLPDENEELEKLFCPKCQKVGLDIILGNKILMPNEPVPPDYENWLQCPRCAWVCPIYEANRKETIEDTITTIENPFDESKGQVIGAFKDNDRMIKRKKKRKKKESAIDKLLDREIEAGATNIQVSNNLNG
jgi:hypothetical protein